MISRAQALKFVLALRDCQGDDLSPELPDILHSMREHLRNAEEKWQKGKPTAALHHIGSIAACAVTALEQHGTDIRDDDPALN